MFCRLFGFARLLWKSRGSIQVVPNVQHSQPTYHRKLFAIQPTRSAQSSSCLTLSRPRSLLISSNEPNSSLSLWHDLPHKLTFTVFTNQTPSFSSGSFIYHPLGFPFKTKMSS